MHKLVLLFVLSITALYQGPVSAQDASGGYRYRESNQDPGPMTAPPQSRYLRWRPLDEQAGEMPNSLRGGRAGPYSGAADYTDQPPGVPAGTYREIEERHTITPQLEGYRFRPIVPEEQLRNRSRNETQVRINRERSFSRAWGDRADETYRTDGRSSSYLFRPDPRFDKDASGQPPRYAFPMGAQTPMFRPQ